MLQCIGQVHVVNMIEYTDEMLTNKILAGAKKEGAIDVTASDEDDEEVCSYLCTRSIHKCMNIYMFACIFIDIYVYTYKNCTFVFFYT